ncbi:MAG: hypothetical protein Q9225_007456 [Loekoesia sp. 1 TL-2023]
MSATTEESDWEVTIIPQSRQPRSNSQSSSLPKGQPRVTPQPILPRTDGPGQSVFAISAPENHRLQISRNQVPPIPRPDLIRFVNQFAPPAPSFTTPVAPVNPAVARVIHENAPPPPPPPPSYPTASTVPPPWNPPPQYPQQQPAPIPMDITPEYVPPASRSIRGVRRGTARGRGGRKPKIKVEPPDTGDTFIITSTPMGGRGSGRARGRGGRVNRGGRPRGSRAGTSSARGVKRKREEDDEKDDSDVSEIITPLPTQSRSGRRIIHVTNFSPVVIDLEAEASPPVSRTPAKAPTSTTTATEATNGKAKKRFSRPGEASVCKNCGRGHSPASNMIVFCDGCNGPWHQFCHDPPISSEVIRIEEQEWYCADCQILREEKVHTEGKVSAEALSLVEKRRYLQSLPAANLVSLLLHSTILHPDLPIFATPFGGPLPEKPKRPITHFVDPTAPAEEDDESYDLYPDSEMLPYPKAGNGVSLPLEKDYLMLLIDGDVSVYSHVWDWKERGLDCNGEVS